MVSHVDDDHIQGILDLTARAARRAPACRSSAVRRFWHNSFDEVIGKDPKELTAASPRSSARRRSPADLPDDADRRQRRARTRRSSCATLKVLASIEQGHRLRVDAEALDDPARIPEFDGKLDPRRAGRSVRR